MNLILLQTLLNIGSVLTTLPVMGITSTGTGVR